MKYFKYNDRGDDHSEAIELFKMYVYNNHCTCPSSCYTSSVSPSLFKSTTNCNLITLPNVPEDHDRSNNEILNMFVGYLGLVKKIGSLYYLSSNEKMTWANIKKIDADSTKILFWLFRKAIIDNLIKAILKGMYTENSGTNIAVYTVGSVKLSSDYDITLYGDTRDIASFIQLFTKKFKNMFNQNTDIIFDTNIYGTSFINFDPVPDSDYTSHVCTTNKFNYIKSQSTKNIDSQLMWAVLHYYTVLSHTFHTTIDAIWNDIIDSVEVKDHLVACMYTFEYLQNQDLTYQDVILQGNKFMNQLDSISMANYFAKEAYFSRGAFLDIVVNDQICKRQSVVQVSHHDLIQSVIENLCFFLIHHSEKYLYRVTRALRELDAETMTNYTTQYLHAITQAYTDLQSQSQSPKQSRGGTILQKTIEITGLVTNLINVILVDYLTLSNFNRPINITFYNSFVKQKAIIFKDTRVRSESVAKRE